MPTRAFAPVTALAAASATAFGNRKWNSFRRSCRLAAASWW